tara:strand:+ start:440 stop:625 length:186 start_codon:yes stop_codon:yes gene_type:complete
MYHIKNICEFWYLSTINAIYDDSTQLDDELHELNENQDKIIQSIEFKELLNIIDNFANNYK